MQMKILFTLLLFLIVFSVYARDINVKYRDGAVNVDNGNFVEFDLKSSSLVKEIFYDQKNEYLLVRLKNTFYHCCSIPVVTVNNWISSPSLGKYYNANVNGNYDCRINPTPEYKQSELRADENVNKKIFLLAMENVSHESAKCTAYYRYTAGVMERDHPHEKQTIADMETFADEFFKMGIYSGQAAGRSQDKATSVFMSRFKMSLEEQAEYVENYGWSALAEKTGLRCKEIQENPEAYMDGWVEKIRERFE